MKKIIIFLFPVVALVFSSCVSQKETVVKETKTGAEGTKLCALTFDDGPDVNKTPLVLDKLEKYGVVASFFVVGQRINDSTKPVLQRAVAMGCEINNHSWAYDSLNSKTPEQIKESIDKTTAAIEKYTGTSPHFFRPPNLAVSKTMYDTIDLPFASGVLGYDWAGQNTSAEDRAQKVLSGMRDGAIILLHDVQPNPHPTPEALDILIPELKKQGYEFVTLSELFKRKGVTPAAHDGKMWVFVN
ncbi:MAG: polysaccharide deacetylase family protein [Spirochaetales bacterium]|nr:polysaccharide deacetylase family protein [Spirochaetales bacterium]